MSDKRTGGRKATQIDLNEYCRHNKHSGVGQGEVEATDQGVLLDVLETERSKAGLWRFIDKDKQA